MGYTEQYVRKHETASLASFRIVLFFSIAVALAYSFHQPVFRSDLAGFLRGIVHAGQGIIDLLRWFGGTADVLCGKIGNETASQALTILLYALIYAGTPLGMGAICVFLLMKVVPFCRKHMKNRVTLAVELMSVWFITMLGPVFRTVCPVNLFLLFLLGQVAYLVIRIIYEKKR